MKKGELFEKECYLLLEKAIQNGHLAIPEKFAKLYSKKNYFSKKREKCIEFDLSIEIWPDSSKNYSIVYLIECKNYSTKSVSIEDLEVFASRVGDVADLNGKAVFISRSSFSSTCYSFAKNTGMMLIQVPHNSIPQVILYKKDSQKTKIDKKNDDLIISDFLTKALSFKKGTISNRKLSKIKITEIANELTHRLGLNELSFYNYENLEKLMQFFIDHHGLHFDLNKELRIKSGNKILGSFDPKTNSIVIDKSLKNEKRLSFVLAHEIGHFLLHRELNFDQETYDSYTDSYYNIFLDRHRLENPKQWAEWQPNYFSSVLLMSEKNIKYNLVKLQHKMGIIKKGFLYLDNQKVNRRDFYRITTSLSQMFNVTRSSIVYRMNDLQLLRPYSKKEDLINKLSTLLEINVCPKNALEPDFKANFIGDLFRT